jgi:hypothetical protein
VTLQPKPVGQRPRCLHCERELRPNYRREMPPISVRTGEIVRNRKPSSFGGEPEYEEYENSRSLTDAERKEWRKDHPPQFLGTYGGYMDNRFCGLNCGYKWAIDHSKPAVGGQS